MRADTSRALRVAAALLLCGLASACADRPMQPAAAQMPARAVDADSGGGTRTLGNNPSVGIMTNTSPSSPSMTQTSPSAVDADTGGGARTLRNTPRVGVNRPAPRAY